MVCTGVSPSNYPKFNEICGPLFILHAFPAFLQYALVTQLLDVQYSPILFTQIVLPVHTIPLT